MPSSGLLIRRTVTDTAGVTIKNSTVTFYPDGSTTLIARTKTDSIGNFDVTLPQGNYSYKITNYVSCNSPGTGSLAVVTGSDVGRPVIAIAAGCPYPRDFILPETITTLNGSSPTARTITLNWTAVNEDTGTGTASAYYIGYSTSPITSTSLCGAATSYVNSVVPKAAGGAETVTLSSTNGLFAPATTYYFCVQAVDESNNKGAWTNTVSVTTIADTVAPGTISLTATQGGPTSINLSWTAVANDGLTASSGLASSYEIRSAANVIYADNSGCGTATLVSNSLVPKALNGSETFTVSGLNNNTDYSICIRAVDQNANAGIWAYASAKTGLNAGDTNPPGSITTLTATALSTTSVRLDWNAVSNDGMNAGSGPASSYEIRRSTSNFTGDAGCNSATLIPNVIVPGIQGSAETFTDGSLVQGIAYYYCVRAKDFVNNVGAWSSPAIVVANTMAAWATTTTSGAGSLSSDFWSVAVDGSGNIYAAGRVSGLFTYGNGVTATGKDIYGSGVLVKYSAAGTAQWAQTVSDASYGANFISVAVDSSGNVYVAGFTGSTVVLVKYNSTGAQQWIQQWTGGTESMFSGVTVDTSGNVYAAGYIYSTGTYTFGTVTVAGSVAGGYNAVLVKYNSSGVAQWARSNTTGSAMARFNAVAVDSSGNIYAVGYVYGTGTYTFGTGITAAGTNSGGRNVAIVKYNSSGTAQWAKTTTTGSNWSEFQSVAVDGAGNIYGAGYISGTGTYTFGAGVTATGGYTGYNVVLVKYNSSGIAQWARSNTIGSMDAKFAAVAVDGAGNVYGAGYISGTATYTFDTGVIAVGASSSSNIILVKYDSSGTAATARTVYSGSSNSSGFQSLAVDITGSVYAAGFLQGSATRIFGTGVSTQGGTGTNVLLLKYQ